jgi:methylated-DNA-[protein]-cysteine S-methyltransferase
MKADVAYAQMDSPIGPVWVATTGKGVCAVGLGAGQPEAFLAGLARQIGPEPPREDAEALASALAQLREYFSRIRREFDLPLDVHGTAFQRAVWTAVARIPYGATTTYGEIARRIGRPQASRAVGAALSANLLPILIPCHRVIGARGRLIGYSGGVETKAALLRIEGVLLS